MNLISEVAGESSETLAAWSSELHGSELTPNQVNDPVLVIDLDYRVQPAPIAAQGAVRLQPDGWPAYAEDPWYPLDDIPSDDEGSRMSSLVIRDDRFRIADDFDAPQAADL